MTSKPEIFFSYAWGDDQEQGHSRDAIVNELYDVLVTQGHHVIRDRDDVRYSELFSELTKRIGKGKFIVVVISDKYLKSPYCMSELLEIYRRSNSDINEMREKIFPIVLEDAKILSAEDRLTYVEFWKTKKEELDNKITRIGLEYAAAEIQDFVLYREITTNISTLSQLLKDMNHLNPQILRQSNFQQIQHALLQGMEEDSKYTQHKEIQQLLNQLSTGSQKYYDELTGAHGPYHNLNIAEDILAGISQQDVTNKPATTRLQTTVKNKEGRELTLEKFAGELWQQQKPHMILLGDGGMGKTVSLIHFWKTLLDTNQKDGEQTIPLFLTLNEYNTASVAERDGFIAKRIAWNYLGVKENRAEAIDALWDVFKTTLQKDKASIILLLDGFNEVTVENNLLVAELKELRQKGALVQILLTSRYEINRDWAEGFQLLELQPLNEAKVKSYLEDHGAKYPEDQRLAQILQNPMMLTLYANANETVEQYKGNTRYNFRPQTTTQGELLWNYLQAQIVKLANVYDRDKATEFYYYKFMISHFLPYLGYEMEIAEQFVFDEDHLSKIITEACKYFYRKEFIDTYHDYRPHLKNFNLKELEFDDEAERFDKIIKVLSDDLRLMKRIETKTFEFLHQNFRDYFAAVHILNELEMNVQHKIIPQVLRLRTLPVYIRRFMGQIAGEHYQTEDARPPATILMKTLDNLRGVFEEENTGYSVWNIVSAWKDTRLHLATADFSELNLLNTGFHDALCYKRNGSSFRSALFDKSLISEKSFLPQGHSGSLECVAFHPDGKIFISGSDDNTIKAWELKTGECLGTFRGHSDWVQSVAFHPNGKIFISGSSDKTIKAWDSKTGECMATYQGHSEKVTNVAFHPDGKAFISGSDDNTVKAWDLKTRQCIATFRGHSATVTSVAFHPDGKTFISGSWDKTIKAWDFKTGECMGTFQGQSDFITCTAFHPDGKTFISGSYDNTVKAWDLKTGKCMGTFPGHSDLVKSVAFHPDGKTFISGSGDKTIKAWDLKTGKCIDTFQGHSSSVESIVFHPGGKTFISGSWDTSIKAWDLKTGQCLGTFQGYGSSIESIVFHPGGKNFIFGSGDKTIKVWDMKTGQCMDTFQGHCSSVRTVAFHPGGKNFISGSSDKTIKAWDLKTGKCMGTFEGHSDWIKSVAFHPDGKTFMSGSDDYTIKVWDIKTGECLGNFKGHIDWVTSVAFHPDGKILISGSRDQTIKTWDLKTGDCIGTFHGHRGIVASVAVHSEGKTFISGSYDNTIKAWDLKTAECLGTFQGHSNLVISVAFHPDGKTFISGSYDNTIKVWDLKTGKCLATFQQHNSPVHSVAFHPDGKTFISGYWDGTIKELDASTGKCLSTMVNIPGLFVAGCSFTDLHPESQISPDAKNIMRQYGGVFDEEDKSRWDEALERVFGEL